VAKAAGNPFFVAEIVRTLRDEDDLIVQDGWLEPAGAMLSPTLRQAILRRVRLVSPTTLELLRAGAVLGGAFALDEAAELIDRTTVSMVDEVLAAVSSGLVEEDGPLLRIRHDLIRDAVYDDLPGAVRSALHARAADVVERRGRPATLVVEHLVASHPDIRSAPRLARLADGLAAIDPAAALVATDAVLAIDGLPPTGRVDELARRARLLGDVGRLDDAIMVATQVIEGAGTGTTAMEMRTVLGESLLRLGRARDAARVHEAALTELELDDTRRGHLLVDLAHAHLATFDLAAAEQDARAAQICAEGLGDDRVRALALAVRCRLAAFACDFDEALELGRAAVAADEAQGPYAARVSRLHFGLALLNADHADEALVELNRGRLAAEDAGLRWLMGTYHNALTMHAFHAGRWEDATAEVEASRRLQADSGGGVARVQVEAMLGLIRLHQGRLDEADDAAARAEAELAMPGADSGGIVWLLWLQARLAELDGAPDRGTELLASAFDLATDVGVHSVKLWYGPELVRLAIDAGQIDRARTVASEVEAVASAHPSPVARAAADRCVGMADEDIERLRAAVGGYQRSTRPFDLAQTIEATGVTLARAGQADDAAASLLEAAECWEAQGAALDEERATARLRALGVRRARPRRAPRPTHGAGSLTATERRVLELVGEGLPNAAIAQQMFISRRTVETHVGRLYQKLGVTGRVALAREADRDIRARTDAADARRA
jgi:DNA-binding CsgD family transcriptional regulator